MFSEDPKLLRLRLLEMDARRRYLRLDEYFYAPDVLRHAKDIWMEARAATIDYMAVTATFRFVSRITRPTPLATSRDRRSRWTL